MKKRVYLNLSTSQNIIDNLIKYACDWSKINAELILAHQSITLIPGFTDSESRQK